MENYLKIRGARTNNLKNIDLDIPLGKIVCFCGPSGSGKSSIAFHTLFVESKRRFINSLPVQTKFFWDIPHEVDVEDIRPILPVWGLPQHNPVVGSRAAVIDLLELDKHLANYFYLNGEYNCPNHLTPLSRSSISDFIEQIIDGMGEIIHIFIPSEKFMQGQFPVRVYSEEKNEILMFENGPHSSWWEVMKFKKSKSQNIEEKLKEIFGADLYHTPFLFVDAENKKSDVKVFKSFLTCKSCDFTLKNLPTSPYQLSCTSPYAACKNCNGHGQILEFDEDKVVKKQDLSLMEGAITFLDYSRFNGQKSVFYDKCKKLSVRINLPYKKLTKVEKEIIWNGKGNFKGLKQYFNYLESKKYKQHVRIYTRSLQSERRCNECNGSRLNRSIQGLKKNGLIYRDTLNLKVDELASTVLRFGQNKDPTLRRIAFILEIAKDLGIGHLGLSRKVKTLSTSEYQRVLLVKYLSFKGSGSMFILDEPTLGLDPNVQKNLFKGLNTLKEQGNSIILVEHSEYMKKKSDLVIEIGPGAGGKGGNVVFVGKYSPKEEINISTSVVKNFRPKSKRSIEVISCANYDVNLKNISFPINALTNIAGDSGTGKSALILKSIANSLYRSKYHTNFYEDFGQVFFENMPSFESVMIFENSNSKGHGRSTVGTLTGLTPVMRKYFSRLPVSLSLGLKDGHFSPNSELGMCSTCQGSGKKVVEMNFLEDIVFTCEDCLGMKVKKIYGEITDGNFTFDQAMNSPIEDAFRKIKKTPKVIRTIELLKTLNLDYLSLDRPISSLSGGERQRVKLLSEMVKGVRNSILFFENLSFGLSQKDLLNIEVLLHGLLAGGNTIVVIDHNKFFQRISHKVMKLKRKGEIATSILS